jgi:transposase
MRNGRSRALRSRDRPLPQSSAGGHRRVPDAIFWVVRTGLPWRDLPPELGDGNSVHRQYRRWTSSGLRDVLLQALADGGVDADALQMINTTIVRAHHCAAGAERGLNASVLGARAAVSRPQAFRAAWLSTRGARDTATEAWKVASELSRLRQSSGVFSPASYSRSTPKAGPRGCADERAREKVQASAPS